MLYSAYKCIFFPSSLPLSLLPPSLLSFLSFPLPSPPLFFFKYSTQQSSVEIQVNAAIQKTDWPASRIATKWHLWAFHSLVLCHDNAQCPMWSILFPRLVKGIILKLLSTQSFRQSLATNRVGQSLYDLDLPWCHTASMTIPIYIHLPRSLFGSFLWNVGGSPLTIIQSKNVIPG